MGKTETVRYTPERFREEYGFEPPRIVDLKALMGDPSDNIPGVPGIGEKTAMELLRRWGSMEQVYAHLEELELRPGMRRKLAEGLESARMSYALATIDTNVPMDFHPAETRWTPADYKPELYALFSGWASSASLKRWASSPRRRIWREGPSGRANAIGRSF